MKRTLIVVLEVEVSDLSRSEREECADMECIDAKDLPAIKDVTADDLGQIISESVQVMSREMFEGSGVYVNFTASTARAASWSPSVEQRKRNRKRRMAAVSD